MNELNNLIRQYTNLIRKTDDPSKRKYYKSKRNNLNDLKPLCFQASLHMKRSGGTWMQKYHTMWKTDFWKAARLLLKEYFTKNGVLKCADCKKVIKDKFVLHHDLYGKNTSTFFNPLYCKILCSNKCHAKYK